MKKSSNDVNCIEGLLNLDRSMGILHHFGRISVNIVVISQHNYVEKFSKPYLCWLIYVVIYVEHK